ncbi:hypothetical protein IBA8402_03070 [Pseudomonas syringae]
MGTVLPALAPQTLYVTIRRDELRTLKEEREQLQKKSGSFELDAAAIAVIRPRQDASGLTVTVSSFKTPQGKPDNSACPPDLPSCRSPQPVPFSGQRTSAPAPSGKEPWRIGSL